MLNNAFIDLRVRARRRHSPILFLPLTELLPVVDVLSLHLPLTPETTGMIDAAAFAAMKRGGVLINTARGPLVDGTALFKALTSGHLRGAGLDVFAREPVSTDDALLKLRMSSSRRIWLAHHRDTRAQPVGHYRELPAAAHGRTAAAPSCLTLVDAE